MVLELREEGHCETADHIEFLFNFEDKERENKGPDSIIGNTPRLKDNKELIDKLMDNFLICYQSESTFNFIPMFY